MKRFIAIIIPILLLATACTQSISKAEDTYELYYFSAGSTGDLSVVQDRIPDDVSDYVIRDIFAKLCSPQSKKLSSMIPSGIKLEDSKISESICTLTLSDRYSELPGYTKAFVDACLTKTFCSLESIESIVITTSHESFAFSDSDFVVSTPSTHYDSYTVNLYFANETFDALCADSEVVSPTPDQTLEHAVVSKLLTHPESENLRKAVPDGTILNNIYVSEEGVCVIDFSREFVDNVSHNETAEAITLYSIINTVTELPMINRVEFLIDGESIHGYVYYDLTKPFTNSSEFLNK